MLPRSMSRYTKNNTVLQRFLTDTKKSDKASKSAWGANEINVSNNYKPGGTAMVAFGKTARRVIHQGIDNLGRRSWTAFEGEDNKVILIISIYQCCKKNYKSSRKDSLSSTRNKSIKKK